MVQFLVVDGECVLGCISLSLSLLVAWASPPPSKNLLFLLWTKFRFLHTHKLKKLFTMYYYDILTYLIQRTPIVVSLLLGLEGGERCPKLRAIENDPDCVRSEQ